MIIVTGATGFIGSAFVWNLNHIGVDNIICVDDYGTGEKWRNLSKRRFYDFVNTLLEFALIQDLQPFF
jgi:ADP-L-glycero-D-manno-heptose 6-epimerase